MALAVAACGMVHPQGKIASALDRQAPLGQLFDRPAPGVGVVQGGPSGVLIGGATLAVVPDPAVDRVVASGMREWLTFAERRSLAQASERAAVAPTGDAVAFRATDGSDVVTAQGAVAAVGDVYRSLRGHICRDVRQSVEKDDKQHAQTVTLCREAIGAGPEVWVVGAAE